MEKGELRNGPGLFHLGLNGLKGAICGGSWGPNGKVSDSGIGDMGPTRAGKFARNGGAKPA